MEKLTRTENPQILVIQETKMKGPEAFHDLRNLWRTRIRETISARGS
jgi:hypothetical protein